jgi:predicted enzyme related to lactoylglutathione lyase
LLHMINIFSKDIDRLAEFYCALFDLAEMSESRTPIFRGYHTGGCLLAFNDRKAFEILGVADGLETEGVRTLLTFELKDRAAVDRVVEQGIASGATLLKPAFESSYGWYQAVLRDPQGNVFRGFCRSTNQEISRTEMPNSLQRL